MNSKSESWLKGSIIVTIAVVLIWGGIIVAMSPDNANHLPQVDLNDPSVYVSLQQAPAGTVVGWYFPDVDDPNYGQGKMYVGSQGVDKPLTIIGTYDNIDNWTDNWHDAKPVTLSQGDYNNDGVITTADRAIENQLLKNKR